MKLNDILYKEVFNRLSEEKQSILIERKADFAEKAGICLVPIEEEKKKRSI